MNRRVSICLAAALSLALVAARPSRADDGNYQNYVLGERAGAMGGAGTASAVGAEACYYNPAGLALAPASSISLSAALYGFHRKSTKDGWFPGEDVAINSFTSIPSTFTAVLKPSSDLVLAFSAFVPDKQYTSDFDVFQNDVRTPNDDHFFRFTIDDQTLWVGPTAAWRLTKQWSVGASVFASYRTYARTYDYFLIDYGFTWNQDLRYSALTLLGQLGVRYDRDDRWSYGLMFQTPSLHLAGSSDYFARIETPSELLLDYLPEEGEARNETPATLRAGAAWQVPGKYAAALDLTLHLPVSYDRASGTSNWGEEDALPVKRNTVLDFNLGGEYYLTTGIPLRAGVFSSFSSAPATSTTSRYEESHLDKYGLTFGVAKETRNTTIGLGVSWVIGGGRGIGIVEAPGGGIESGLVDEDDSYLLVSLSSSYSF